jgi:hypothetical protein
MYDKKDLNGLVEYIVSQVELLDKRPELYRYISDGVRNNMFYMVGTNDFFTGNYSYDAYKYLTQYGNMRHSGLCKEHHYSLKKLTDEILGSKVKLDTNTITQMIKEKGTWNYTTKEENVLLKSNNQSYERCGIKLNTFWEWESMELGVNSKRKRKNIDLVKRKKRLIDMELVKKNEMIWDRFIN